MWHPIHAIKKRTIVRFVVLTGAVLAGACSGVPHRLATSRDCPPAGTPICEDFGPESRCRCADARALVRELERLGLTARGVPAW